MNPRTAACRLISIATLVIGVGTLSQAQLPPTNGTPTNTTAPLPSDPLFDDTTVKRVDLWVNSLDWEKLKQNFQSNQWYPADVILLGQTVHNVGIRSRGLGSRSPTKPGIRVDFDRYVTDQTHLGMKAFILDNLTQDHSGIRETVAMKLFAKMGIPAPREAFVRLYVKNEYAGLYAISEEPDKPFLARIFGKIGEDTQNDGHLYEFDYVLEAPWNFSYLGPGLEPYMARFSAKTHEKETDEQLYRRIETLVRLVNELPIDQFFSQIHPRLDLFAFVRYMAAQNFVAQNDGFLGNWGMNNFYLYRKENSEQHVFIAWDEDNAFWGPEFPTNMRHGENVLMQKCMQIPELRAAYGDAMSEALAFSNEPTGPSGQPWLQYEVQRQSNLIYEAMAQDTKRPYSIGEHEAARDHMFNFANTRGAFVQQQLDSPSQGLRRP